MPTSTEQRMASLKKANNVREKKKIAKEKLRSGEITVIEAFTKCPLAVRDLRVEELLVACPGIGRKKAGRILLRANLRGSIKMGICGPATRKRVLAQVEETCPLMWRKLHA